MAFCLPFSCPVCSVFMSVYQRLWGLLFYHSSHCFLPCPAKGLNPKSKKVTTDKLQIDNQNIILCCLILSHSTVNFGVCSGTVLRTPIRWNSFEDRVVQKSLLYTFMVFFVTWRCIYVQKSCWWLQLLWGDCSTVSTCQTQGIQIKSHDVQDEVEDAVKKLQVENARLEAELQREQERTEVIQAELVDSQKVGYALSWFVVVAYYFVSCKLLTICWQYGFQHVITVYR